MKPLARISFLLAGLGSFAASMTHIWAIFAGPAAYASLGAPLDVVASAEAGTWYAPTITAFIAVIILGWALYVLSAAGRLPRLPLLRTGLIAIVTVLVLRGLIVLPIAILIPAQLTGFVIWSSFLCLVLGALYGVGIIFGWTKLGPQT